MQDELLSYADVLLGREEPPIDKGLLTLMEFANAVFSRAAEMTMIIQKGEREGLIPKGSPLYKFRTGELRTFMDLAAKCQDLGSRRITYAQMQTDNYYGSF